MYYFMFCKDFLVKLASFDYLTHSTTLLLHFFWKSWLNTNKEIADENFRKCWIYLESHFPFKLILSFAGQDFGVGIQIWIPEKSPLRPKVTINYLKSYRLFLAQFKKWQKSNCAKITMKIYRYLMLISITFSRLFPRGNPNFFPAWKITMKIYRYLMLISIFSTIFVTINHRIFLRKKCRQNSPNIDNQKCRQKIKSVDRQKVIFFKLYNCN